jgi:hypothetical protein
MTTAIRPVGAAEQAVTEARKAYQAASDDLTALKNKILTEGPAAVTAHALADAASAVEHARLSTEHALAMLGKAQGDERLQQLNQLKARILTDAGSPEDALNAMQQIETGVAYLVEACVGRQRLIAQATTAMRQAGVPAAIGTQQEDGHAGLGWANANMAGGDSVIVDQRRIGPLNPGLLISAAIACGTRKAGHSTGHLLPALQVDGQGDIANDPETWLRARY